MARVTTEDCIKHVDNMYELVLVAAQRARQMYKGSDALVPSRNRIIVTSLREIAAGLVKPSDSAPVVDSDEDLDLASLAN